MEALKAFTKSFKASQRSVNKKILVDFYFNRAFWNVWGREQVKKYYFSFSFFFYFSYFHKIHYFIKGQSCHHIETSQFILKANQITGFYMIPTWAFNESIKIGFECKYILEITCLRGRFGINCPSVFWKFWNCPSKTRAISRFSKILKVIYPKNRQNQTCGYWLITQNQQTVFIETNIL